VLKIAVVSKIVPLHLTKDDKMGEKMLKCVLDTLNKMSPSDYGKLLEEAEENFDPFFESVDHYDYLNENLGSEIEWLNYEWETHYPINTPCISKSAEDYNFAMAA
jgi:hypothetical protein